MRAPHSDPVRTCTSSIIRHSPKRSHSRGRYILIPYLLTPFRKTKSAPRRPVTWTGEGAGREKTTQNQTLPERQARVSGRQGNYRKREGSSGPPNQRFHRRDSSLGELP